MIHKISFNVIFASDETPEYPASELNAHGPTVQGWRCRQNTQQEIVLRFHKPSKIYRIQVLAHQYLIPERIELWLHYSTKSAPSTPSSLNYDYLGFIALSDNASTNYKSRELQSVCVTPKIGTHLKLRLGASHANDLNKNGQVALIAINILGETVNSDEIPLIPTATSTNLIPPGTIINNNQTILDNVEQTIGSVCDDLAFSMYVEESVVDIVREMETLKGKAVNDERFEYARKLKLCMSVLRTAGERLGRYALAKRQAVQQEDFTTARLRKEQIEIYRNAVFEQLQVIKLLEKDGVIQENDMCSELYASKPTLPSPPSLQDVASSLTEKACVTSPIAKNSPDGVTYDLAAHEQHSVTHKQHQTRLNESEPPNSPHLSQIGRSPNRGSPTTSTGSLRRRNKSAPRNSYEDYDERAIPTLRHSHTNEFLRECQGSGLIDNETSVRGRSRLNDRERRQAALPILVLGNELVELFYSRHFQDREDGLAKLRLLLKGQETQDFAAGANKIARSSAFLLHRCVRDAVFSVFSQAAETVRALFMEFVPNRVSTSEVARCVDRLLPELLAKSGDPSARIHTLAQHTILSIAACPEVREQHLIAPAISRSVGSGTHPRLALSRMQMVEQLVLSQGISTDKQSGLTCRALSECGCSGIHHPAESVRKVAERVLLLVYKVNPRLVRKQLPPDDDITRRNLLYRQLFTEFDKLDLLRKKEMLEGNKQFSGPPYEALSPPFTNTAKYSPPVEIKHKSVKYDSSFNTNSTGNKNKITEGSKNNNVHASPIRRSDTRILKSKSGHTLEHIMTECNDKTTVTTNPNGFDDSDAYNDQREFLQKIKPKHINNEAHNSRKSSNSDSFDDSENRCPFCDCVCQGDPSQLDRHYWKACPVLTKCPQCSQVLEIAAFNYHLLNECETKNNYLMCEKCSDAVHKELYEHHLLEDHCKEVVIGATRCPLCHDVVHLPHDGGWKRHLLSTAGCRGNARRRSKI